MKKSIFVTVLIILLSASPVTARTMNELDSLLSLLSEAGEDKKTVEMYIEIGEQYDMDGNTDSAGRYYLLAGDLSRKIDYPKGLYDAMNDFITTLNDVGAYDSALAIGKELASWMQAANEDLLTAHTQYTIGNTYAQKGFYETALTYYQIALAYYETIADERRMGMIYNVMQTIYLELDATDKAVEYGEKALNFTKNTPSYPYALLNTANSYSYAFPKQYDKAEVCLNELLSILEERPNPYLEGLAYNNLGDLYLNTYEWEEAENCFQKALSVFSKLGDPINVSAAKLGLAYLEFYKNNNESAEKMAYEVLQEANEYEAYMELRRAYSFLGDLSIAKRDFKSMKKWYAAADSIDKILTNERVLLLTEELQVKYETEKKDIRIAALAKEKSLFFILMVAGAALALLILVILLYKNRLHRRQKQLLAAQVALESESAERSRLAKDLHDGLGGMLSLVKINLNDMKGMKVMTQEDAEHFGNALNMLDNSITELRRVAHHIMPESLIKNGLKTSLEDFTAAVPGAEFHFYGTEKRLDNNLEVVLYRSAHELVNNALKHSSANHINIQLIQECDRISLTVDDNGKGFDQKQESKGAGLKNIRNRIAIYDGEMHIFSDSQSGTEINIEIPLKE